MTQAVQQMQSPVAETRKTAVADAVAKVRQIEQSRGVNREALVEIKAVLLDLAQRKDLFPLEDFPLPDEKGLIYRLSEDADNRFALYMSCGVPGKKVPPHNHTTWAVIVGLDGNEENYFYERTDGGTGPGPATLRQIRHEQVRDGTGVTLMPEDIHHIETGNEQRTLHFHMYGLSLEHLDSRVMYDLDAGSCRPMSANPNIVYMQ